MFPFTTQMVTIFLWFLCTATLIQGKMNVVCNEKDHNLLSMFKKGIKEDPSNRLSSWSTQHDCCNWTGVQCNNITGRVTKLQLKDYDLSGEINSSLLELEFLSFLDLSLNNFEVIDFKPILASSNNQSSPKGTFSNLVYLDLSYNFNLHMDNLRWLASPHLSSLKYLNLSGIDLTNETLWLQRISMLPSLMELRLSHCSLNGINPSHGYVNFTSLTLLDIYDNHFNSEMPKWLFNLSTTISYLDLSENDLRGQIPATMLTFQHLNYLDLSYNHLNGSIPKWMGQYKHLERLDLSYNSLSGPISATIGNLSSLTFLNVRSNRLNGSFPRDLGKLSNLESLFIGNNSLSGNLSEQSFTELSNLKFLGLYSTAFIFNFGTHWKPLFQLEGIIMRNCKVGPEFPSWLYTQRFLHHLDISSSGLSFNADDEFWSFVTKIDDLNLSNNSISGDISTLLIKSTSIDLHSNNFTGGLPRLSPIVSFFNIADNKFSGHIYTLLCQNITGKQELETLDMSQNLLSGEIPDSWMHWPSLVNVNLGSNNLSGKLPNSMGSLIKLRTLRLRKNILSRNVPSSLQNCKSLWYLDLMFNEFRGNIPTWFSHRIMVLLLRSNRFSGSIPSQICQLSNLQVLDLANNRLSGPIPKCFYNITPMVTGAIDEVLFTSKFDLANYTSTSYVITYLKDLPLFVKGQDLNYWHSFMRVHIVDLSNNDLLGPIPREIFSLIALQSLNLSHNHLTGKISSDIGDMRFLESLDLSRNLLSGEIPESMSNLYFLGDLNLSYNNLNGRIPLGTQLQSFEASSYIGNPQLWGPPLTNNSRQEDKPNGSRKSVEVKDDFKTCFQVGMAVGFVSCFWGVCGAIFFIRRWRHAYFRTLDNLYVSILIQINRFRHEGH